MSSLRDSLNSALATGLNEGDKVFFNLCENEKVESLFSLDDPFEAQLTASYQIPKYLEVTKRAIESEVDICVQKRMREQRRIGLVSFYRWQKMHERLFDPVHFVAAPVHDLPAEYDVFMDAIRG